MKNEILTAMPMKNFMLVSCLTYFSTLKIKAVFSSERPVYFCQNIWRYVPEDSIFNKL
jgi:hypothetical protein